jgi:uncharacterized BrkB/YihY/UPF0761 family membrane protein
MDDTTLIVMLIPLVLIQLGLNIFATYDIYRHQGAKNSTVVWLVVIWFISMFGAILYFVFGRKEEFDERD